MLIYEIVELGIKFAEMVGVTQPHITNILSGRKNASVALTKKIEEVTEGRVTFKDIFNTEAPSRLKNKKRK